MKHVTIRRCPACPTIRSLAESVAVALRQDDEVHVQIVDGMQGDFLVEVNGMPLCTSATTPPATVREVADTISVRSHVGV